MSSSGGPEGSGKHARRDDPASPARRPATVRHGTTGVRLAAVLAVLGVVVMLLIWSPWSGGPDSPANTAPSGPPLPTYGADWRTAAGDSYRLTVTPAVVTSDRASAGGCYPAPVAGRVNVRFDVRIENLSHHVAPVPDVEFGANLGPEGRVRPRVLAYDGTSHPIELSPVTDGTDCSEADGLGPQDRTPLPADTGRTWTGLVAGITPGAGSGPAGLRLIVRYQEVDVTAAGGSTPVDVVVPFAFTPVAPVA